MLVGHALAEAGLTPESAAYVLRKMTRNDGPMRGQNYRNEGMAGYRMHRRKREPGYVEETTT